MDEVFVVVDLSSEVFGPFYKDTVEPLLQCDLGLLPRCFEHNEREDVFINEIMWWNPDDMAKFKEDLKGRVLKALGQPGSCRDTDRSSWVDDKWLHECRQTAQAGLKQVPKRTGSVEAFWAPVDQCVLLDQTKLEDALKEAHMESVPRASWEFSVGVLGEIRRRADGIGREDGKERGEYEFWSLKRDGSFYVGKSFGEDLAFSTPLLCFDERIQVVAEILAFCYRLSSRLGLRPGVRLEIHIEHGGLGRRYLEALDVRWIPVGHPTTDEKDPVTWAKRITVGSLKADFQNLVAEASSHVLGLFGFRPSPEAYQDLLNPFQKCLDM